jgi:hypothetical protein
MKREQIKGIITDLTKDYIRQFGVPHQPKELAQAYWDVRLDHEIERDEAADVILLDYELWVICVVADHQTDAVLLKFKTYRK